MKRLSIRVAVATALAFGILSAGAASAATSRVCRQLEAELAGGGQGATQSRRNDAAIAKQRAQLQATKRQARASGCGFRLFGARSSSCDGVNAKIDRLERNIASLQRKQPASAARRSRAQIMAAMRSNGCGGDQTASTGGPRNLLEQIFGGGMRQREIIEDLGPPQRRDTRQVKRSPSTDGAIAGGMRFYAPPGRYRTLCVRTCDGYYYPLSTSSRPSDFARDHANCQASCPAAETQIYYTRPDGEADTMVSGISGQAYIDLPSAFLYKQIGVSAPAGCTCNVAKTNVAATQTSAVNSEQAASQSVQTEQEAPVPASAADQAAITSDIEAEVSGDRRVRVVGPVFLPDPAGAIDLRAPAPSEVQ